MSRPAIFRPPPPRNEPVLGYEPGSPERAEVQARLTEMAREPIEIPVVIGGEEIRTGDTFDAVMPHDKEHVLAHVHKAGAAEVDKAIAASAEAWEDWHRLPWEERAAVFLRAAELLSGPWRSTLVASTMLNQSKTAHQAEIDAACETIDFWRFNVQFMVRIYEEQPVSSPGVWNRLEYRPLEGFVFAISPFNFTAIGANLIGSPALMGDVVLWKPAFFGVKPELILKGGFIAWAAMGDANASIPTPQPVIGRPMFGHFGKAPETLSLSFVSQVAYERGIAQRLGLRKGVTPIRGCRTLRKKDLIHNQALPDIEVNPETYMVKADGQILTCEPVRILPLAQRYFLF